MSLPSLNPFSLELKKDMLIALGAVLLVMFMLIAWLAWSRGEWKAEAVQSIIEIEQYQQQNQKWADEAVKANLALEQLKVQADNRAAVANRAISAAQKKAALISAGATALLNSKPVGTDECAAISAFIDSYYGGNP